MSILHDTTVDDFQFFFFIYNFQGFFTVELSALLLQKTDKSKNMIVMPYTVFTNGGHAGKDWCLVMKARRRVFSTDST